MTRDAILAKFPNASEAFKKRNPELFRPDSSAGIRPQIAKRNERGQGEDRGMETGKIEVRYSVTILVRRPRLLDDGDNDRTACKPLRDRIAEALGLPDDRPPGITFSYQQIKSKSRSTTVIIETITK